MAADSVICTCYLELDSQNIFKNKILLFSICFYLRHLHTGLILSRDRARKTVEINIFKNIFLKMFLRKHLRRYLIIFNLKSFRLMIITLICRLCKNMDFEVIFIQSLAKTPYTTPKLVMLRQFLRILKKNDLSNILTNILE